MANDLPRGIRGGQEQHEILAMAGETVANILVIDDDDAIRSLLEMQLQRFGHVVTKAADGRQGFEKLKASNVELIITDIFMPGQDGFEFLLECSRISLHGVDCKMIRIIVMTGNHMIMSSASALRIARKFGAFDTIIKPFTIGDVKIKVEHALLRLPIV